MVRGLIVCAGLALAVCGCGPQPQVDRPAATAAAPQSEPSGTISVENGQIRPGAAGATSAAYFSLRSAASDRLIAASSPVAERVELHQHVMDGAGLMGMRPVEGGIAVAPEAPTVLQPGGLHLMFFNLKQDLLEGQSVPVTLTFETAGPVEAMLTVGAPAVPGGGQPHSTAGHAHE